MNRLTAKDFSPEVLRLFDQYVHGLIDRRGFLHGAARYATAAVSAELLLAQLAPNFAQAEQVKPDDARITVSFAELASPQGNGQVRGYLAKPAGARGKLPAVLVVHENRGLNPHIADVTRRLALQGYLAFAPDALFTLGGYPGDEDRARELFQKLDQPKARADFLASARWLKSHPEAHGKVGVVGFCYGGAIANHLAVQWPELDAAVPFYGGQPAEAEVARIKAPLLIHYAENDERVNAGWPAYQAALKREGVRHEAHTYAGTQHGFHNDTTPRYDAAAAQLAWGRTLAFFQKHLSA
jgi:carboxymethylenebutenolidase